MADERGESVPRMHDEEVEIDHELVRQLLRSQFPEVAPLRLVRVPAWGTDHAIFRLGDEWSVRLPKIHWAAGQGEKEKRWLSKLSPYLPVEVPVPYAVGEAAFGYPFRWYISPWIEGQHPSVDGTTDLKRLAIDVATFVKALQQIGTTDAPRPQPGQRGGPLQAADAATRESAERLRGETDVDALLAVWYTGLRAPAWTGPAVWVHGDLSDGNLLLRDGHLSGVIDWGGLVAGDPAVELMIAWNLFDRDSRQVYRESLGFVDDAMWLRGRAWAVSAAVQALPYYRETNQDIVDRSWRAVRAVLEDLAAERA